MSRLYLFGLFIFALGLCVNELWGIVSDRRRLSRLATLTPRASIRSSNPLLRVAQRLLGWYRRDSVPYLLSQAGNPRLIGETPGHFYASKIILGLLVGARLGHQSATAFLVYGLLGFMIPDVLIAMEAKRRKELILAEVPTMLDFVRRALAGHNSMLDTLAALPDQLEGPLKEETKRLAANYALTMNLPRCLEEFSKRIGLEEIDNFCLALRQSEVTGRIKEILGKQSEIIKMRFRQDERRRIATQGNFLPVISVLMVANIIMLVAIPFMYQLTDELQQLGSAS